MKHTLEQDMAEGRNFWLGPIVAVHRIGEYAFLEYQELAFNGWRKIPTGQHHFSIYINGEGISRSAASLDKAMIYALAYKYDGANSQAAPVFVRMLEIDKGIHKDAQRHYEQAEEVQA